MSFESATLGFLTGHAGLTALVPAEKIYAVTAPQELDVPFVVFMPISMDPTLSTDNGQSGAARLDNYRLQVSVYCATFADSVAAAEQVRRALESQTSATATKYICTDDRAAQDDFSHTFGKILQFSCWHPSTS